MWGAETLLRPGRVGPVSIPTRAWTDLRSVRRPQMEMDEMKSFIWGEIVINPHVYHCLSSFIIFFEGFGFDTWNIWNKSSIWNFFPIWDVTIAQLSWSSLWHFFRRKKYAEFGKGSTSKMVTTAEKTHHFSASFGIRAGSLASWGRCPSFPC